MKDKPKICLIDDDPRVHIGWEQCLYPHADLRWFRDPVEFLQFLDKPQGGTESFECVVVGRLFPHVGLDLLHSEVMGVLRAKVRCPLFLNWQGYVGTRELEKRFDGKVFHRFGIKWHTLKMRLQRLEKAKRNPVVRTAVQLATLKPRQTPVPQAPVPPVREQQTLKPFSVRGKTRQQRCKDILQLMVSKADPNFRDKLQRFVSQDPDKGVELLEALYNRLITYREPPSNCPSRFINSSPLIAAKLLREALHP